MSLDTTINYKQDIEAIKKLVNVHRATFYRDANHVEYAKIKIPMKLKRVHKKRVRERRNAHQQTIMSVAKAIIYGNSSRHGPTKNKTTAKKNVANKIIKTPTKFRSTPPTPRLLVLWSARGGRMIDGWWPLNCDVEICVKLSKTYIFFASWHFKLRPQRNFALLRVIVLLQADTYNSVLYTGRVILLKRS